MKQQIWFLFCIFVAKNASASETTKSTFFDSPDGDDVSGETITESSATFVEEQTVVDENNPRFCNKSTTVTVKTECKPCSMTALQTQSTTACPPGSKQLTTGKGDVDCTFVQRLDALSVIYLAGCRHTCEQSFNMGAVLFRVLGSGLSR